MKKLKKIILKRYINCCDICGNEAKHTCFMCGKDLCNNCTIMESDEETDYPGKYCQSCWDKGERFRNEIEKITKWYKDEVFGMKCLWKEKVLEDK